MAGPQNAVSGSGVEFTHLHVHTVYSLLDGASKIPDLVARAKELGMNSLAITDHGVMYGVIEFYHAAKKAGIKPIIGCEVYVAPGSRFDHEGGRGTDTDRYYHLVLLAENNTGYHNLMKIVSRGFTEGYYYRPRVDYDLLREYHEGIIALSACLAGEVARKIVRGTYGEAVEAARRYEDIFGKGNFFLELQDHGIADQKLVNSALLRMSRELDIPLVATNDCHYILPEDAEPHDVLLCMQTNKKISDTDRLRYEGGQYYLKSKEEMLALFPYAKEALANTQRIADRCNVEIEFGVQKLPRYDVPEGRPATEYLREQCEQGLALRYPVITDEQRERLDYELNVIENMGYVDYFLIVWDYVRYARSQGISVGPGRGSAAGSLVAYCLNITNVDPISNGLLFERFLNPERVSMPDIDVDFTDERRQEVINYVMDKYGRDRCVQIITFGTLGARSAIRNVGRVMEYPYSFCDKIARMIPNDLNITIAASMQKNPEMMLLYNSDEQAKALIDMAMRLEGVPNTMGMHAAGVVICSENAEEFIPLSRAKDCTITTQFPKEQLEELGLLKMDFLGLRTLTVIENAVRLVKQSKGTDIDIEHIDFTDQAVYESLGSGRNEGVFQLESGGMKTFMKELKPQSLEDLTAGISLYRPGPMNFIPKYVQMKNHPEDITYDCPQLEPILKSTYGCIVYQEQVMQIVRDLGGYTMGRSDLVRRAMAKKHADEMARERQNFVYGNEAEGIEGCVKKGIPEKTAVTIFDELMEFADYAFNKSHAAAYAVVSYETAWLKYYYPVEFMAAIMTSVKKNNAKVSEYILICREMGIDVLPPDVNEGYADFSVSGGNIRYGMSAVKSLGDNVNCIVQEREENGPFTSLKDFIFRMKGGDINKKVIENLIKAGAFDCLPGTRRQKMMSYADLMEQSAHDRKNTMTGQLSLFDMMGDGAREEYETPFPDVGEYEKSDLLAFEKEVLGIYVSGHPLDDYRDLWERNITAKSTDFIAGGDEDENDDEEMDDARTTDEANLKDGAVVVIGGMITDRQVRPTRNSQLMAFLTVEDLVGSVDVLVFPKDYEKYRDEFTDERKIFIRGKVSIGDDPQGKLIFQSMIPFEDVPRDLDIAFTDMTQYAGLRDRLREILKDSDGPDRVVICTLNDKKMRPMPANWNVRITQDLLRRLGALVGPGNVKVVEKSIDLRW